MIGPVAFAPEELRSACAEVTSRARWVRVETSALEGYAQGVFADKSRYAVPICQNPAEEATRTLILDAINFGSGWFPTLRKRPGLSGYRTIAANLQAHFESKGPWTASELQALTPPQLAHILDQRPDHPLMALYAASLNDLGAHLGDGFDPGDSAVELAGRLAEWSCFQDASRYEELTLPFLKRAQIAAADLHRAGAATYDDLHRLTIFADNLVPHVLAVDGILVLAPALADTIAAERLLVHDSPPEVELRACAVHACALLAQATDITEAELDALLWERGGGARYKALPRPRCRCTAY